MITQSSWAQALEQQVVERIARVKHHAAYRIKQLGGRPSDQDSAALAALLALLNGASAASAIEQGVDNGKRLMAYCRYRKNNIDRLLSDIKDA